MNKQKDFVNATAGGELVNYVNSVLVENNSVGLYNTRLRTTFAAKRKTNLSRLSSRLPSSSTNQKHILQTRTKTRKHESDNSNCMSTAW